MIWWVVAARAALAIGAGMAMLTRPGMTLGLLFGVLGAYLFLDGALALVTAFHAARGDRGGFWRYLVEGLLSVGVGILAFVHPAAMKVALLSLLAARFLITGVVEIATASSVEHAGGKRQRMLWVGGVASLVVGVLLLARPAATAVVLVWLAGIYAVVFGVTLAATAIGLRRGRPRLGADSPA